MCVCVVCGVCVVCLIYTSTSCHTRIHIHTYTHIHTHTHTTHPHTHTHTHMHTHTHTCTHAHTHTHTHSLAHTGLLVWQKRRQIVWECWWYVCSCQRAVSKCIFPRKMWIDSYFRKSIFSWEWWWYVFLYMFPQKSLIEMYIHIPAKEPYGYTFPQKCVLMRMMMVWGGYG